MVLIDGGLEMRLMRQMSELGRRQHMIARLVEQAERWGWQDNTCFTMPAYLWFGEALNTKCPNLKVALVWAIPPGPRSVSRRTNTRRPVCSVC